MAATSDLKPDICVIGAGSGGLSVAAGAAAFGVPVVLIEKGLMGGDCLNYGCVPSKALIAAASHAEAMRSGMPFGIKPVEPDIDFTKVMAHVKGVIGHIAPLDSVERFRGLGVSVIQGTAEFVDKNTVEVGGQKIRARRFVIASGSTPFVPPVPGLDNVAYLTNETVFELKRLPRHLLIVGGGPIGIELGQAFRRLGSEVTILDAGPMLGREDPELAGFATTALLEDGVTLRDHVTVDRVERARNGVRLVLNGANGEEMVTGSHLLVATGRKPTVEGLGLEAAGIKHSARGIEVNDKLKTSNPRVFAIGDCIGDLQFTHAANYHAGLVLRAILFRMTAKRDNSVVPRATYCDPEIAAVGLSEEEACRRHDDIRIMRWPLVENDRAQAERDTAGLIKVISTKKGVVLGAGIVGPHAGELIHPWTLAVTRKMKLNAITGLVFPYPTLGEISKRAAVNYYLPSLASPWLRRIIGWLRRFG
ncbi:MAG: FAD-dependent oxidoreductase [Pseudomonadota bacterium]